MVLPLDTAPNGFSSPASAIDPLADCLFVRTRPCGTVSAGTIIVYDHRQSPFFLRASPAPSLMFSISRSDYD